MPNTGRVRGNREKYRRIGNISQGGPVLLNEHTIDGAVLEGESKCLVG